MKTSPPPLVFTFHLIFLSLVARCSGTSVNGFSDWRQSCPTTNLAIQVIHLLLISILGSSLFGTLSPASMATFTFRGIFRIGISSDLSHFQLRLISSYHQKIIINISSYLCILMYPHANSTFPFPSWYPAVQSLGKKQEVFLHQGKVGEVLSKWRKKLNWEQSNKQKVPPYGGVTVHRYCSQKSVKSKRRQCNIIINPLTPALILSSCNISPFNPSPSLWGNISEIYICMINSFFAQHICPPSQISVPLPFHPLHSFSTHYMQLYIYLRLLYLTVLYILRYIYVILCVIYPSLFCQSDIVNTPQVWNTALFCLRCEETF